MAAPELVQEAESTAGNTHTHLEVSVTMESPPPPHVANSNPARPAPRAPAAVATTDHGNNNNNNSSSSSSSSSKGNHSDRKLSKSSQLLRSLSNGIRKHRDYVKIQVPEGRGNQLPQEWWKTGVALVYAVFNLVLTTVVITVVHERVPDKSVSPPLPDKFFDYVERVPWAFTVTEVNGLILMAVWFIQWLFLKHKSIIARRCFFLIGTLYLYRCVTMYITTLPVPGKHMTCAPKLYGDSGGMMWRILGLISGGGLSITGGHLMCGDYLYSGHTVMLTLAYLLIKEYSPRSMWWYHLICWLLSAVGVVCILIGHEHYSIDVIIAYFITSRLFWWYHTMANTQALRRAPNNFLSRTWWNPVFTFLERNVQTSVPCVFSWPLAPPFCTHTPCERYSMVE